MLICHDTRYQLSLSEAIRQLATIVDKAGPAPHMFTLLYTSHTLLRRCSTLYYVHTGCCHYAAPYATVIRHNMPHSYAYDMLAAIAIE